MDQQRHYIRILRSEETHWEGCSSKLETQSRGGKHVEMLNRLSVLEQERSNLFTRIGQEESKYVELRIQQKDLSPELISQGWGAYLQDNAIPCRNEITRLKIQVILDVGKEIDDINTKRLLLDSKMSEAERMKSNFSKWREEEVEALWKRQRERFHENEKRERIRCIGSERKWAIRFTTLTGKPDKKREQLRLMSSKKLCITGAGSNDSDNVRAMTVNKLIELVRLQNKTNILQHYTSLWRPFFRTFQSM